MILVEDESSVVVAVGSVMRACLPGGFALRWVELWDEVRDAGLNQRGGCKGEEGGV